MRQNLVLTFGAILLLPFLFGSTPNAQTKNDQLLIIRVTSVDPKESLMVEGCYLFLQGDKRFETVKRSTPFETQAQSQYIAAIFHKTSGKAHIHVELLSSTGGEEHLNVAGSSSDVILTTDVREKPFRHVIQTTE
jgi:hypothetical protein